MSESPALTRQSIAEAIASLGLRRGDVVLIYSDLRTPGIVAGAETRDEFCAAYLNAIQDVIGQEGTVVVPTYTPQVARFDVPFDWAETPGVTGIFAEYVRTRKAALRSLHPLHSLAALGPLRKKLCSDNGTSDYGWESPYHRLHQVQARALSIGLSCGYALAMVHYIEAMCGLPYVYNKLLKWAPIVDGVADPRPFFASVRHLNLKIQYDFNRWTKDMVEAGALSGAPLGRNNVFLSDFNEACRTAAKALRQDPYYFLHEAPNFVPGELPFDGATEGRDGSVSRRNSEAATGNGASAPEQDLSRNWTGLYFGHAPELVRPEVAAAVMSRPAMRQ